MNRIYIKSCFGDWQAVDAATAKRYIRYLYDNITRQSTPVGKSKLIDNKHLKGISMQDLLKD